MRKRTKGILAIAVLSVFVAAFPGAQAGEGGGACGTIPQGVSNGEDAHGGTGEQFHIQGYLYNWNNLHGIDLPGTAYPSHQPCS